MRTPTPTRQKLLDAALGLMLERGFSDTSVDDVCRKARLTKGSFFHYFKSKEDLGRALLEAYCCAGREMFEGFIAAEKDPLKRVHLAIDGAIAMSRDPKMRNGCLLGAFSQECCDTHPKLKSCCEKGFSDWARALAADISAAKAARAPRAEFDPEELADHFIATLEGALLLGKAQGSMKKVAAHLRHYQQYLDGLLGVKS
ncbi:MAG: TetR/AcrR family transcriptional regulator [Planctomycetes bacterium]|nr:TetR/AcrR family transcriptional regulator [Planctomycetota bacterium]